MEKKSIYPQLIAQVSPTSSGVSARLYTASSTGAVVVASCASVLWGSPPDVVGLGRKPVVFVRTTIVGGRSYN